MNWFDFIPYFVAILLSVAISAALIITPIVFVANRIKEKKRIGAIVKRWELEDAVAAVLARREVATA